MTSHVGPFRSFVGFDELCESEGLAHPLTVEALSPEYQPLKIFVWHSPPVDPHINLVKFQLGVVYVRRHITPLEAGDFVKRIMPEHLWSSLSCDLYVASLDLDSPTGFTTQITEIILVPGRDNPMVPACFDVPEPPSRPSSHVCPFRSFVCFDEFAENEGMALTDLMLSPGHQPLKVFIWHSPPVAPHINLVKFQLGVVYVRRHITPLGAGELVKEIMPERLWSSMSCDLYSTDLDPGSLTGLTTRITEIILVPGRLNPAVPACFDDPEPPPPPSMSSEAAAKRARASDGEPGQ